jgi:hypothetical protein
VSILKGKKRVSFRTRVLKYCKQNKIDVPAAFRREGLVHTIAVLDLSVPRRPALLGKTFDDGESVLQYLKDNNKHPENYKALDFERGIELLCEVHLIAERDSGFCYPKDVYAVY